MTTVSRRILLAAGASLGAAGTLAHAAAPASTERPVRRKDLELTRDEALYVIEHTNHAVLATSDDSGTPYAVPVTPVLFQGKIYVHGTNAPESRKRLNLRQNPRVSLAWIGTAPMKEDEFTTKYVSAIVAGRAREVTDKDERWKIMTGYTNRFAPSQSAEAARKTIAESLPDVVIWEIEIEKVTGKAKTRVPFFGPQHKDAK